MELTKKYTVGYIILLKICEMIKNIKPKKNVIIE